MAAILEWTSLLEVDHEMIDTQHKALITAINEFGDAVANDEPPDDLTELLLFLTNYTKKHFREEEALMERSGYPELSEHKRIHASLEADVERHTFSFIRGDCVDPADLLHFLKSWLVDHIMVTDRHMVGRLAELNAVHEKSAATPL